VEVKDVVMIDIPDKVWRVWEASWESCVTGDKELVHMLLAEIWEESWKCLTTDGTFIPYCLMKEHLSSIDVKKLITQYRGKSVKPLVHKLEKMYPEGSLSF
jgi:hypothetical protein